MKMTCSYCKHSSDADEIREYGSDPLSETITKDKWNRFYSFARCHRYPPSYQKSLNATTFPPVEPHYWCGEFELVDVGGVFIREAVIKNDDGTLSNPVAGLKTIYGDLYIVYNGTFVEKGEWQLANLPGYEDGRWDNMREKEKKAEKEAAAERTAQLVREEQEREKERQRKSQALYYAMENADKEEIEEEFTDEVIDDIEQQDEPIDIAKSLKQENPLDE